MYLCRIEINKLLIGGELIVVVYKLTNRDNDKVYIGCTKNLQERVTGHITEIKRVKNGNNGMMFYNSLIKEGYDETSLDVEVIDEVLGKDNSETRKELISRESYWINYYQEKLGKDKCYNIQNSYYERCREYYNNIEMVLNEKEEYYQDESRHIYVSLENIVQRDSDTNLTNHNIAGESCKSCKIYKTYKNKEIETSKLSKTYKDTEAEQKQLRQKQLHFYINSEEEIYIEKTEEMREIIGISEIFRDKITKYKILKAGDAVYLKVRDLIVTALVDIEIFKIYDREIVKERLLKQKIEENKGIYRNELEDRVESTKYKTRRIIPIEDSKTILLRNKDNEIKRVPIEKDETRKRIDKLIEFFKLLRGYREIGRERFIKRLEEMKVLIRKGEQKEKEYGYNNKETDKKDKYNKTKSKNTVGEIIKELKELGLIRDSIEESLRLSKEKSLQIAIEIKKKEEGENKLYRILEENLFE